LTRIAAIRAERKRRKLYERIRYFQPTEPPYNDQRGFLYDPAKIRFALGGNRSGKTEVGAADTIWFALGKHEIRSKYRQPPIHGRVCAPKYEDGCKGVVLKKMREMIPHHELAGSGWTNAWSEKSKLLAFANGSTINFKSSEMDLNTYGGADLDFVWDDEHIPEKYFLENMARLTDRNGYYIKTMTPEAGQTWEEDFINNPPEGLTVSSWFFSTDKNPYLSTEGIEALKATIKDPRLFETKLHGHFTALGGLVIPQYDPLKTRIPDYEIPRGWPKTIIIDPHLKKPTAIVWLAWPEEGVCVVYRTKKVRDHVEGIAQLIRAESARDGKIDLWIADEAHGGKGPNIYGQESVIKQLNDLGLPFKGTNVNSDKAFEAGVNELQASFSVDPITGKPSIFIFESCYYEPVWIDGKVYGSLDWELKRYQFKKEQKADEETFRERVRTVDDDYLDCLRYGRMAGYPGVAGTNKSFGVSIYGNR